MRSYRCYLALALSILGLARAAGATELLVTLSNVPTSGQLVFQVYDDPDAFGDFRDPAYRYALPSNGDGEYRIPDIEGREVALLVYFDENENGALDKNFIGIPRELLGLSNGYRPKGPPSFDRASFELPSAGSHALEIELFRVLGNRGQLGAGLGVIGRGSPYVQSDRAVQQVIPTITYIGERLQWFGPQLSYGILGSGAVRLAVTAAYRIGAYEEDDSPLLLGLGDRDDTLMLGLGLQYELPKGFEIEVGYQHDALDRIGGGIAQLELSRGFQAGIARLAPELSFTWVSGEVSHHDFGVPAEAERPDRVRYRLGSTRSIALGLVSLVELSEHWRTILNVTGELLDPDVRDSPIVEDDTVISGFAAITYAF